MNSNNIINQNKNKFRKIKKVVLFLQILHKPEHNFIMLKMLLIQHKKKMIFFGEFIIHIINYTIIKFN